MLKLAEGNIREKKAFIGPALRGMGGRLGGMMGLKGQKLQGFTSGFEDIAPFVAGSFMSGSENPLISTAGTALSFYPMFRGSPKASITPKPAKGISTKAPGITTSPKGPGKPQMTSPKKTTMRPTSPGSFRAGFGK